MTGSDTPEEGRPARKVVLRYEDTWEELEGQLHNDRSVGLSPSVVRDDLTAWLDPGSFVEVGTLVRRAESSYGGGDGVDERPNDVPSDGLIAGWGRRADQLVFVAADDTTLGSPLRGGAGASKATRIRNHALEQSAPLLQVFAANRLDPEVFVGAEFVRFGYGVDIDFEADAADRILKVGMVTGPIADQAALEVTWCHLVVMVGADSSINGHAGRDALARGMADAVAEDLCAALELVDEMMRHLPASRFDPGPESDAAGIAGDVTHLLDGGWRLELWPSWQPEVKTVLATVGGRAVGYVELDDETSLDQSATRKMLRLIRFCDAFGLPLIVSHDGLHRPDLCDAADVDALADMRHVLHTAMSPILEIRRGAQSLEEVLGVRALWSASTTETGACDALVPASGVREATLAALAGIPLLRRRAEEDPRLRLLAPRTLQSQ